MHYTWCAVPSIFRGIPHSTEKLLQSIHKYSKEAFFATNDCPTSVCSGFVIKLLLRLRLSCFVHLYTVGVFHTSVIFFVSCSVEIHNLPCVTLASFWISIWFEQAPNGFVKSCFVRTHPSCFVVFILVCPVTSLIILKLAFDSCVLEVLGETNLN